MIFLHPVKVVIERVKMSDTDTLLNIWKEKLGIDDYYDAEDKFFKMAYQLRLKRHISFDDACDLLARRKLETYEEYKPVNEEIPF
jgi:hypothetical protein